MRLPLSTRALALFLSSWTWLEFLCLVPHVCAEDAAAADSNAEAPKMTPEEEEALRAKIKDLDDKAAAAAERSDASNNKFLKNFQSLQAKLDGWKAAISAAGDNADPKLVEAAAQLEKDLREMGIEYIKTVGADEITPKTAGFDGKDAASAKEFLGGCLVMSVNQLGSHRASTHDSLRLLVEKQGPLIAADFVDDNLWRTVGTCVSSFTSQDYADFKAGKLKKLPEAYASAAKLPESEKHLTDLDQPILNVLRDNAKDLLEQLKAEPPAPPMGVGMLALIPMGLAIAFLYNQYSSLRLRDEENRARKDRKEAKKSK